MSLRTVGTNHSGYNEQRNIISVPHSKYVVEKCFNPFKMIDHFSYKVFGTTVQLFHNSHVDIGHAKVDLYHFFNGISLSSTPWVTTFETSLPRLGNAPEIFYRYYLRALRGDRCKRLIAMSEHARNNMLRYLDGVSEDVCNEVVNKLTVLHPPQAPLLQSVAEKRCPSDGIVFTIIGHDFFRKGGEILRAFDGLLQEYDELELHIVSCLQFGDYASKTTQQDLSRALAVINRWPGKIHHHRQLPWEQVLEQLSASHVALLPSWDDTYGYSVLEAQAAGCPVITTDIRALPEINNEEVGWLIPVPKDENGFALRHSADEREKLSRSIFEGIYSTVKSIMENQDVIYEKGQAALERIKKYHDPKTYASRLEMIYDEALSL